MERLDLSDATVRPVSDCSMQSSSSFDNTDYSRNDATDAEKCLLDLDLYMEDLQNRLIISRMVSDSVINGTVGAISEEAAEKVASKEAELAFLKEKLHFYESNKHGEKEGGFGLLAKCNSTKLGTQLSFHDLGVEQNHTKEHLVNLKIAAEEQICRLKKEFDDVKGCTTNLGSLHQETEINKSIDSLQNILEAVYEQINNLVIFSKTLLYERHWESKFQEEVDGIVFQSLIRCVKEEFEEKSHEKSHMFGSQHKNTMIKVDELSSLRQDLDAISRSLFGPEPGKLSSHGSHEFVEERSNIERKDRIHRKLLENHFSQSSLQEENGAVASEKSKEPERTMPYTQEPGLQCMNKDKLINYFKDEITKMKRNHESVLQEKTEEYYSLKREYLREKDSSNWRKDKEFDALRKKIPEIIIKLDNILAENEKSPMVCDDHESICGLKVKADNLLFENRRLRSVLMDKRKEVKCLSSQVSDAADKISHLSLAEENFSNQINKLKCDIEDVTVEASIREEVYKSILRELIGKTKCDIEDVAIETTKCDKKDADIETIFAHEICMIVLRESAGDVEAVISDVMMRYNKEKERGNYLEALLLESDRALHWEIEENQKLKQEKASKSEVVSTSIKQKKQFELACNELDRLKDQASQQERLLNENKKESDLMSSRLEEALEQNDRLTDAISRQERLLCEIKKESDCTRSRLEEVLKQIDLYKVEKSTVEQKLKEAMDTVNDSEIKEGKLYAIIQEKQNMIQTAVANELNQKRQMKSVIISLQELSREVVDFESRVTDKILLNNSR